MVLDHVKLICLVREKRCLWSRNEPNYKDNKHKQLLWEDIGRKLNVPGHIAKNKWRNLRDTFAKKCTAMNRTYGSGYTPVRWKYYKQMLFLRDMMETRPQRVSFPSATGIMKSESVDPLAGMQSSDTEEPTPTELNIPTVSRKRPKAVGNSQSSVDPLGSIMELELTNNNEMWREHELRNRETRKSSNYYFLNSLVDQMETLPLEVQLDIKEQYLSIMHAALRANSQSVHSENHQ
ncbi:uncharacterized protein LOC128299191 [Anopheles moucheti]|uniref:uncharacterized protein LOC128299191 n=1 Tax=Anopheles moucheti TaxID=186751 RepID=UPI0022F0DC9F|nr:uncharacterized protein LOC128299191 [Anopheles moucheti]